MHYWSYYFPRKYHVAIRQLARHLIIAHQLGQQPAGLQLGRPIARQVLEPPILAIGKIGDCPPVPSRLVVQARWQWPARSQCLISMPTTAEEQPSLQLPFRLLRGPWLAMQRHVPCGPPTRLGGLGPW